MASQSNITINTREDLDKLIGTQYHADFMAKLKGTMLRKQDNAVRPDNYGSPEYTGAVIPAEWVDIEDLSIITQFGFSKTDFL